MRIFRELLIIQLMKLVFRLLDHQLLSLGINNIVINPTDIPTTQKNYFKEWFNRLSEIARGLHAKELTPIHVMSRQTLEDRSLVRTRSLLVQDITRSKSRVKSFLYFHGISIPAEYIKRMGIGAKVYKMVERRTHSSLLIRERSFELFDFERGKSIRKSQRY